MEPEKLGPFKIGRVLGRGGMGAVYEGISEADASTVAVKVLTGSLDEDAEDRLRFETEIETLKHLHHPNIVRLAGFGEDQERLYYVMEFIDGSSLQQELRKKRLFQWHEVAKIGLEICQALRHAHDRGIIHRDIKPANILLDQQGNVKLSDFGIARFFGAQQITDAHTIIGTLEYMSPEQALANPITSSTDLYSLGCVLYALLTGKPPFPARSLPELLRKLKSTSPAPIRSIRYDVPDNLGYIITDLLQIHPEDRPRNALLVTKRLKSLLQALMGDPAEIRVFPMTAETPRWLHESSPETEYRHSPGDAASSQAVKPGTDIPFDVSLSDDLSSSSFRRAGERPSTGNTRTVTVAANNVPSDTKQSNDFQQFVSLTTTKTSSVVQHGEIFPTNKPTLRPAKDEPFPDEAAHWSESPLVKPAPAAPPEKASDSFRGRPDKVPKKATRFTAVSEKHLDSFEEEKYPSPIFSLPAVLTSLMLMIVGLTVYYLIQPVPPEVLFKRITRTIQVEESEEDLSPALLRSARGDIESFLDKYSEHPLAEKVRYYRDELELAEYDRRLERRAQSSALRRLSPVERAYVGILVSSPHDPEQTIDKLGAFIAVFQTVSSSSEPHRSTSSPVEICVELARRRLKKMECDVDEINAEQVQVLRQRLEKAKDLDSIDPIRAEEIRRGMIELYQNHRWAKELIEEAKQHLKE